MIERHRGFVVGSETRDKRIVWTVRVKDRKSEHDGQKLVVASVHGGLELARGLNVSFVIGSVDDQSGKESPRAVDVRVETPGQPVNQVGR